MSDETKELPQVKAQTNGHSHNGEPHNGVPGSRVRIAPASVVTGGELVEPQATQLIANVDGQPGTTASDGHAQSNGDAPIISKGKGDGHAAGNGLPPTQTPLAGVRPVKVRVSNGHAANGHSPDGIAATANDNGTGASNGHLNGHADGNSNGNGAPKLQKARVVFTNAPAPEQRQHTQGLTDTHITELRLKLKREEWEYNYTTRKGPHNRELPYFLMRQRRMRARTAVGHARVQTARRRFGGGGPALTIISIMLVLFILMGAVAGAGMGGAVAGAAWYINNKLPPVTETHGLSVQTTKIYDRNGILLTDFVDEETGRRHEVSLADVSPLVISATIAAEDGTFYTNPGIEPMAIIRALTINYGGKGQSGASTITQQLVRSVNLPPEEKTEQSAQRKVREAIQAIRFTQYYQKNEILRMYLNENYYGHRAYGIDAAALTYFGKSAKDVNLAEAAMLAGMPQAPTDYDPFVNGPVAKRRQAIVLDLMAKQGFITQDQADEAKAATLALHPYVEPEHKARHFVYYVKSYLEKLYGADASNLGLVVTTTLDLRVQQAAEKVAKDRIDELRRQKATNASIVIMKPNTGEILAMVGSVDYNNTAIDGQVNVAISERQPGSSFKPLTYVTAFEKGWTPGTVLLDTLTSFPNPGQKPYIPKNYDGKDHGWVTVRESLGNSFNIPAVKAIQYAGLQNVIDTAHDMGITGLNRGTGWYGLSLTLGGGEVTLLDMTNAYSTFANGGVEVDASPILQIEDPQGRIINCNGAYTLSGGGCSSVPVNKFAQGKGQVLDERNTYMITSILSDNRARTMEFGPNSPLKLSFPAAAKTGTTNDNRDSWTMGYTPDLAVGVWVGNSNNAEMLAVTGAIGAAVIWHNMMESFYSKPEFVDLLRDEKGDVQRDFVQPPGLIRDSACSAKGAVTDLFLKDNPPKGCTTYKDKNPQLHSAPTNSTPVPRKTQAPAARPTPLPGIWPPLKP